MRQEIDDIVKQAFDIAGIVPYNMTLSDTRLSEGIRLLKGNAARYSNDDLLCCHETVVDIAPTLSVIEFTDYYGVEGIWQSISRRKDFDSSKVTPATEVPTGDTCTGTAIFVQEDSAWYVLVGDTMRLLPDTVTYLSDGTPIADVDPLEYCPVPVKDIAKVKSVWQGDRELTFVPLSYWNGRMTYSWTQRDDAIYVDVPVQGPLTFTCNKGLSIEKGGEVDISIVYAQLLVYGLAVSLSLKYPRQDDNQMTRLQSEYGNILNNCRTPLANRRQVLRSDRCTAGDLLSGRGLF